MVTEALLSVAVSVAVWVLSVVPFPAPPDWFTISEAGLDVMGSALAAVSAWVPLGLMGAILAAYLAIHAGAVVVRLARQVLSYLTLGGGAT